MSSWKTSRVVWPLFTYPLCHMRMYTVYTGHTHKMDPCLKFGVVVAVHVGAWNGVMPMMASDGSIREQYNNHVICMQHRYN